MSCNCAGYTNAGLMGGAYNDAALDGGYMLNPTQTNKTYLQALLSQAETDTPGVSDALKRIQARRTPKTKHTLTAAQRRALVSKLSGKGFLAKLLAWAVKGNIKRWIWLHQNKKEQEAELERLKAQKAAQGTGAGISDGVYKPWHMKPAPNPMAGKVESPILKQLLEEAKDKIVDIDPATLKKRKKTPTLTDIWKGLDPKPPVKPKPRRTGSYVDEYGRFVAIKGRGRAGKRCAGGGKFLDGLKKFISDVKTLTGTPILPLNIALLVKKKKREAEIEKLKKELGEA